MTDPSKLMSEIRRVILDSGVNAMQAARALTDAAMRYQEIVDTDNFRFRLRASTSFIDPTSDKPFIVQDPDPPKPRSSMSADEREVLIILGIEFCQSQREVPSAETRSRASAEKIAELLKRIEP